MLQIKLVIFSSMTLSLRYVSFVGIQRSVYQFVKQVIWLANSRSDSVKKTRSCKVTSGECKWNETCQFQVKEGVNIFTLSIALIFIYKGGLMMMVSSPRGLLYIMVLFISLASHWRSVCGSYSRHPWNAKISRYTICHLDLYSDSFITNCSLITSWRHE